MLLGSSDGFLQHFGMFQPDGDQHAGRAGRFALFLFPTTEGAEADSEKVGEGFLRAVGGLADFGNFAFGFPCFGRLALSWWIQW
jgi:hypothetical protein